MIGFITKHWVWAIVAVLIIYLIYTHNKKKQFEAMAVAAYTKINSLIAQTKQGQAYASEKANLLKLLNNLSEKEKAVFSDLLNGTMNIFTTEQQKDKEKEKQDFVDQLSKMQTDLIAKHGKATVISLKAKMDKYNFDI